MANFNKLDEKYPEADKDRCLTCWEHGSPFDGPCRWCGYNATEEKLVSMKGKPHG